MAKVFKSYREESKKDYGTEVENSENLTREQLEIGSLLRIADATEIIAQNYVKLQTDYEYMRSSRDKYKEESERMADRIKALKGVITKMKNKSNRK